MGKFLFNGFEKSSASAWKQKIQVDFGKPMKMLL